METDLTLIKSESGQLLRMAIEKDLDIDKLKALMDLRDRDERFRAERDFEEHFAVMQKDYIPAYKSKDVKTNGGKTAYSYCPLPQILAVYAPILARHGFSYRWEEVEIEGKGEKRTTCFLSGYGFSRQASISLPYGETNQLVNATQARGATSEYGRRYTFMNVTGCIVADDTDSDGRLEPVEQEPESPNSQAPANGPSGFTVLDEPVPKDYKDKKAEYRSKGYGCKRIDGKWKWVHYGSEPAQTVLKLTESERSQLLDMMNEMEWSEKKKTIVFQKAEFVGGGVAIDSVSKEYEKYCSQQAGKVMASPTAAPSEVKTDDTPF